MARKAARTPRRELGKATTENSRHIAKNLPLSPVPFFIGDGWQHKRSPRHGHFTRFDKRSQDSMTILGINSEGPKIRTFSTV